MNLKLAGKVAVVSGAGAGIGKAAACLYAKNGAKVVVAVRTRSKGEETVRLIKEAGGKPFSSIPMLLISRICRI